MRNSPSHWHYISLAEVADHSDYSFVDGPFGSDLKSEEYSDEGIRLIQLQNIGDGYWIDDNKNYIPPKKFQQLRRHAAYPGDIVIAKMADPLARACRLPSISDIYVVVADCIRLKPDQSRFDTTFIMYAINHSHARRQAESISTGTTRNRINLTKLKTIQIGVPPLSEQRAIAHMLDTLDREIKETNAIIGKLELVKRGLLSDLLLLGVTENSKLRQFRIGSDEFRSTRIGYVHESRKVLTLQDVLSSRSDAMRSGPFGSALLKEELTESGIPVIGIDNVYPEEFREIYNRFIDNQKYQQLKRYTVFPGDVLITIMGTVGRSSVAPNTLPLAISSKHVWTISLNKDIYIPELLCAQLNFAPWVQEHFLSFAQGSTMPAINSSILRTTPIPVPSIDEQRRIASIYLEQNQRLYQEIKTLEKLMLLKKGVMDDLLTGRVRAGNIDIDAEIDNLR